MLTVVRAFRIPTDRLVAGDLGVEIEIEGKGLNHFEPLIWARTRDGSLKPSPEAVEYVLRQPLSLAKAKEAVELLYKNLKVGGSVVNDSVRAGVHVHLNAQDLTIVELYNLITLYLCFEELLVKYCGPSREGNLFCLRASDAEYLINRLEYAIRSKKFLEVFSDEDLRYSSVNVTALVKYGSLEFRSMRTTVDSGPICRWIDLIYKLKVACKNFSDPGEIISFISKEGVTHLLEKVFGALYAKTLLALEEDITSTVWRGMRNAQDIAFSVNWESYKLPVTVNPFSKAIPLVLFR